MLVDRRTNKVSALTQCKLGVDYVNPSLPSEHNRQMRTCFTATVAELRRGQAIQLQDISIVDPHARPLHIDRNATHYFGIVDLRTFSHGRTRTAYF